MKLRIQNLEVGQLAIENRDKALGVFYKRQIFWSFTSVCESFRFLFSNDNPKKLSY